MNQEFIDEIEVLHTIYDEKVTLQEIEDSYQVRYIDDLLDVKIFLPFNYPLLENYSSIRLNIISFTGLSSKKLEEKGSEVLGSIEPQEPILFSVFSELITLSNDYVEEHPSIEDKEPEIDEIKYVEGDEEKCLEGGSTSTFSPSFSSDPIKLEIIHGPSFTVQKSVFQSHIAAVSSIEEVSHFFHTIKTDKKYSRATHNILSFRFFCEKTKTIHADCDDDGETSAAGRLLEMMRLMGSIGVAVVVSRWFGGILLGPDRFKYINNSARSLLEEYDYCEESKKSKKKLLK